MSRQKSLSGPHTLHPQTGMAPGYARIVFVQHASEPAVGRATARFIASKSLHLRRVKVSPDLHAQTTGLLWSSPPYPSVAIPEKVMQRGIREWNQGPPPRGPFSYLFFAFSSLLFMIDICYLRSPSFIRQISISRSFEKLVLRRLLIFLCSFHVNMKIRVTWWRSSLW